MQGCNASLAERSDVLCAWAPPRREVAFAWTLLRIRERSASNCERRRARKNSLPHNVSSNGIPDGANSGTLRCLFKLKFGHVRSAATRNQLHAGILFLEPMTDRGYDYGQAFCVNDCQTYLFLSSFILRTLPAKASP